MKSLREYLAWAEEQKVAIGHFNVSDSEGFKAVVEEAEKLGLPVIIGVSEGESDFIGLAEVISLVKTARENGLPVFINADHTYSVERAKIAIDAGVDSVIIDAADKTLEENIKLTEEVVEYAKSKGQTLGTDSQGLTLVEGELGFIGKSSKLLESLPSGVSSETQTSPEAAVNFVRRTGVDLFAPSVGNVHGMLVRQSLGEGRVKTGNPKLNIRRIEAIHKAVGIPLVLHGGSGVQDQEFRQAIAAGIRIIHINTELRLAYKEGIAKGLKSSEIAPYKFLAGGVVEMKKVVHERLKLFNNL